MDTRHDDEYLDFEDLQKLNNNETGEKRRFLSVMQGTFAPEGSESHPNKKFSDLSYENRAQTAVFKQIAYQKKFIVSNWEKSGKKTNPMFNQFVLKEWGVYRILSKDSIKILLYTIDSKSLLMHVNQCAESASTDKRIKTIQDFQNQLKDSLNVLCQSHKKTKATSEKTDEEEVKNFKRFVKEKKEEVLKCWETLKVERALIKKQYEEDERKEEIPLETRYLTHNDFLFRHLLFFTMGDFDVEKKSDKYVELSYVFEEIDAEELVKKMEEFIKHYLASDSTFLPQVFQSRFKEYIDKLNSKKGLPKQDEVKEITLIDPKSPKKTVEIPEKKDEEFEKFKKIVEEKKALVLKVWQSMQSVRAGIEKEYEEYLRKEYKKNQENIFEAEHIWIEIQKEKNLKQKYLESEVDFKRLLLLNMGNISENESLELVMKMDSGELVKRMDDFIDFYFSNNGTLSIKNFQASFKNYIFELNKGNKNPLIQPPKPIIIEPEKKPEAVKEVHQNAWQSFFQWLKGCLREVKEKFNQYFCACFGSEMEVQEEKPRVSKSNVKKTSSSDRILGGQIGFKTFDNAGLIPEMGVTRELFPTEQKESKRELTYAAGLENRN